MERYNVIASSVTFGKHVCDLGVVAKMLVIPDKSGK